MLSGHNSSASSAASLTFDGRTGSKSAKSQCVRSRKWKLLHKSYSLNIVYIIMNFYYHCYSYYCYCWYCYDYSYKYYHGYFG